MAESPRPAVPLRTYAWWLVLCVVGLDYLSTLAYLPSIAVAAVGVQKALAPLAAIGGVGVTMGYTQPEIAKQMRCTVRSVEYKVSLIREKWTRELADAQ